jgi:hypothetical protein
MSSIDISSVLPASPLRRVLRLALSAGELHRVPRGMHNVQVLSGIAWTTVDGQDAVSAALNYPSSTITSKGKGYGAQEFLPYKAQGQGRCLLCPVLS